MKQFRVYTECTELPVAVRCMIDWCDPIMISRDLAHFPSATGAFFGTSVILRLLLPRTGYPFLPYRLSWGWIETTKSLWIWIKTKRLTIPLRVCYPTRRKSGCFWSLFNACFIYFYYNRTTTMVTTTTTTKSISNSSSDPFESSRKKSEALIVDAPPRRSSLWVVSPEVASYFIGE